MLYTSCYKALEAQSGGANRTNEGNLTSAITSTFALVAGIASLLDIEQVDKAFNKQDNECMLRHGPLLSVCASDL